MSFLAISCREDAIKLLQSCGIGPTRQRIDIARVLFTKPQHLSADQVHALIDGSRAYASKATVYNTLNLFVQKGLVREVVVDPNRVFYDSRTEPHHHFYDVVSGRLTDIPNEAVTISSLPPLPAGMVKEGVDVLVRVRPAG